MSHFQEIVQFIQKCFSKNKIKNKKAIVKYSSPKNIMHFPCLNCGNLINQEQIDNHSKICVFIDKKNSTLSPLENSMFKLRKIQEHLNGKNKILSNYYFSILSIYIDLTISVSGGDEKCIDKLKAIITNINSLLLSNKCQHDYHLQILMERVKILIIERIKIIKSINSEICNNISQFSSQNKSFSMNRLETINSFVGDKERLSLITLLSNSNTSIVLDNEEVKCYDNNNISIQELYKEFLKIFLKIKFKFGKTIFQKQIHPKELFSNLIEMKIPCSEWKHCIFQIFKNKYNKTNNVNKMDTINEEE